MSDRISWQLVARGLTTVNVKDNSSNKWGMLEIEHSLDQAADPTNSTQRMELCQTLVRRQVVARVLYSSEGDCIEPDTARRVLDS